MRALRHILALAVLVMTGVFTAQAAPQVPESPKTLDTDTLGQEKADTVVTIITELTDSASRVIIDFPEGLDERLYPHAVTEDEMGGPKAKPKEEKKEEKKKPREAWFVQVYSDSNKATARGGAERMQRNIAGRYPQMRPKAVFKSPYWKVYVGPFGSADDAKKAMQYLRGAFPSLGGSMRLFR